MTGILTSLATIVFFLWTIRNIAYLTYLWQLKEYRFDRFFSHIRETEQGRSLLFSTGALFKWLLVAAFPLTSSSDVLADAYPFLVIGVFSVDVFKSIQEVRARRVKIPKLTLKATLIMGTSFVFVLSVFSLPLANFFFWLVVVDRVTPLFIAGLVFFLSIPSEFYHDQQIAKAAQKLARHKNLIVIGVTGSYGKTSSKEFIARILEQGFSVIKTSGTNNTPIGVAKTILEDLEGSHQIFVAEMAAYKKGEIKEICDITKPRIGVLTAVNAQHLSLFGSLKNTMEAKYELIDALPTRGGMAIFNGENENALALYHKTKKAKYLYALETEEGKRMKADIVARNIVVGREGIEFDVIMEGKKSHFRANLLGAHNIENMLPGIFIAYKLGMTIDKIRQGIASLRPLPMTMKPLKKKGITLIDDTFSVNPGALSAALDYLRVYPGKKILVLHPMIELGKEAEALHYVAGKEASQVCDHIFLTNNNFVQSFMKGAREVTKRKIVSVVPPSELAILLARRSKKGTVILFEGREAGRVLRKMEELL